jgi:hypothetical protein
VAFVPRTTRALIQIIVLHVVVFHPLVAPNVGRHKVEVWVVESWARIKVAAATLHISQLVLWAGFK